MALLRIGCRHILAFWGFLGFVVVYMLRINLSVALVAMVNTTQSSKESQDQECPSPANVSNTTRPPPPGSDNGEFTWDETQQGIILGSFFWGYVVTQLPGGWYAERHGGKWLFGLGVFCTSIFTLVTPVAARWGIVPLIIVRVIEGLGEAVTYPAMHALLSHWSPPLERSKLACFAYSGIQMGTIIGLPLSGLLCQSTIAGGWPSVFYIFGAIGCLWFVCWSLIIYDTPISHPRIDPEERNFIVQSIGIRKEAPEVPWKKIATSVPFWSLLVAHVCHNWTWYTVLTCLPTFMARILKFDIAENGFLSCLPYVCDWLVIMVTSHIADFLRERQYMTTGAVRKMFNSVGLAVAGGCLVAVGYVGCNAVYPVMLFCFGVGFLGLCQSGFNINHLDIAPQFAGTLAGLTNTVATLPGIAGPYVVGILTQGDETRGQWLKVFYIAAAIDLLGLVAFQLFSSGEQQPWAVQELKGVEDDLSNALLGDADSATSPLLIQTDPDQSPPRGRYVETSDEEQIERIG